MLQFVFFFALQPRVKYLSSVDVERARYLRLEAQALESKESSSSARVYALATEAFRDAASSEPSSMELKCDELLCSAVQARLLAKPEVRVQINKSRQTNETNMRLC